jgi:hypothetical protein
MRSSLARPGRSAIVCWSRSSCASASLDPCRKSIGTATFERCPARVSDGLPAGCNGKAKKTRPMTAASGSAPEPATSSGRRRTGRQQREGGLSLALAPRPPPPAPSRGRTVDCLAVCRPSPCRETGIGASRRRAPRAVRDRTWIGASSRPRRHGPGPGKPKDAPAIARGRIPRRGRGPQFSRALLPSRSRLSGAGRENLGRKIRDGLVIKVGPFHKAHVTGAVDLQEARCRRCIRDELAGAG